MIPNKDNIDDALTNHVQRLRFLTVPEKTEQRGTGRSIPQQDVAVNRRPHWKFMTVVPLPSRNIRRHLIEKMKSRTHDKPDSAMKKMGAALLHIVYTIIIFVWGCLNGCLTRKRGNKRVPVVMDTFDDRGPVVRIRVRKARYQLHELWLRKRRRMVRERRKKRRNINMEEDSCFSDMEDNQD